MAASKEFYEAASKDKALWDEAERAMQEALAAFLKERGLEKEAAAAVDGAVEKVASAHGFAPVDGSVEKLSLDELDAVAGGVCACVIAGAGKGNGKNCGCGITGYGENDSGKVCVCAWGGGGEDD